MEAPHEERMDQGNKGDSDEERSDSTPDDSCSPASSQGSACHMCRYSLGHHLGGVSWADQCPSEDEGGSVSGGEEHASHIAIDGDAEEETPTASQDEQGPPKESLEEMGEPNGTAGIAGTLPTDSQDVPTNSQDEVTIHMMEEEIRGLD